MPIEVVPLPIPDSADHSNFESFGREVKGIDPSHCSTTQLEEIREALFKHEILLFRDVSLSPEQQYALSRIFDPISENYGHGNSKVDSTKSSILHSAIRTLPRVPQVQLVGNGVVYNHEGLDKIELKQLQHYAFHKTVVSSEDKANGVTRFYRWHIDAALYDLDPPQVTTLYAVRAPKGPKQTCRYDDGTGDELKVPLATTAFVSGQTMFRHLPAELKSLAVRAKVKYAPHPYVWMAPAHAKSTGLGMVSEGLEKPLDELPPWSKNKIKVYPMLWANPVSKSLSFQVHPCCVAELIVDPLPAGISREGALFPDGACITDLREVRDLLDKMQRPAIAPRFVYPHDWRDNDLIIFHNRGVLHSAVGTLTPQQVRLFHQCNLAASTEPTGPSDEDISKWA